MESIQHLIMKKVYSLPIDALLLLLKQDDGNAFQEIYNRYWSKLYTGAYRRVKCSEVAEEMVQDFFTSLWVNRQQLKIDDFEAYSYSAIRYRVFQYFQKEGIRDHYKRTLGRQLLSYDNSTEEQIWSNDLNERINEIVAGLPEKCRFVYDLSRNEYKTNKEIAAELGISEKTVENHLTKALSRIRGVLNNILVFIL